MATIAVARAAADIDTAPYTQDITTTDLGGLTPVGAFFTITYCTSDGTPAADANFGLGACDGTREWAVSTNQEDGVGTTDNSRCSTDAAVIKLVFTGSSGSINCEAEFSSFITNGVRINWTNAPAGAYLITVTFIAGDDSACRADNFTVEDSEDASIDITDVGFEADFVLFTQIHDEVATVVKNASALSFGAVVNDGADTQACWCTECQNAEAATNTGARISDSYAIGHINIGGSNTWAWAGEISDFDANGFTCTTREGDSGDDLAFYFAVQTSTDVWLDVIDTPTSTGADSQTGAAFTPQFVMCGLTQMPAVNTGYTDGDAGSWGVTVFDTDDAFCNSSQNEDAADPTDSQSLSSDQVVDFPLDSGAAAHVATFTSFDANGWTWNFSDTEGTAKKWWALAVETSVARVPRFGFTNFQIPGIV